MEASIDDEKATRKRNKVLVVDDEYGPRESIAYALSLKYDVETANGATEALARIGQGNFDCIVLDIRMPNVGGLEALPQIRELDPFVGVIMLTGYGTLDSAQEAMLHGANQYMRKPPNVHELTKAVQLHAENARRRRNEEASNAQTRRMMSRLKQEMADSSSKIWQGRASVELVHDLANPLTVMIGYAGLLREEAEALRRDGVERASDLQEFAGIVEKAAEYCHHLAENWREASRNSVAFTEVNLAELAEEVKKVIFYSDRAIEIPDSSPFMVQGSRFDLARVIQNLIRNAMEAGATKVHIEFNRSVDATEMRVRDNGSGMDEETLVNSLKGGYTTKPHGTGLGLNICRHLTKIHGAEFSVESEIGTGTTFRIRFPRG